MKKGNKGITLIALVITIIVMLILVGVTITMAVNGGLFEKAGEAATKTNNAVEAEQALSNGAITVGGQYYNSIGEYMEEIQKQEKLIEFEIEDFPGVTFYAKEGMTWGEWVNSEYNTIGATLGEVWAAEDGTYTIKVVVNNKARCISMGPINGTGAIWNVSSGEKVKKPGVNAKYYLYEYLEPMP